MREVDFRAGLSHGQQRNDVARRQWRIGAVRQAHFAGLPAEVQRDFILLDGRGGFHVDYRIEPERVREIQITTVNKIFAVVKIKLSGNYVDMPEQNRMFGVSANAQAGIRFQMRSRPFHP